MERSLFTDAILFVFAMMLCALAATIVIAFWAFQTVFKLFHIKELGILTWPA